MPTRHEQLGELWEEARNLPKECQGLYNQTLKETGSSFSAYKKTTSFSIRMSIIFVSVCVMALIDPDFE